MHSVPSKTFYLGEYLPPAQLRYDFAVRVLLTGNLGYIGTVLGDRLVARGFDTVGLDTGYFEDCVLGTPSQKLETLKKDIRDVRLEDLEGFDSIVHLAALSNDPLGQLNPSLTREINYEATMRLAWLAKEAGVRRFVYASSQSMYGISSSVDELREDDSEKNPVTEYAKTKWLVEQDLKKLSSPHFMTVSFRPSTVFGASARQRTDIVFNNLVGSGFTTGRIEVKSDGSPWRPVVHVQDVCSAFESGLIADEALLNGKAYNVGPKGGNYSVRQLAEAAQDANPGSDLKFSHEHGQDSRTYRVNFDRIHNELGHLFSSSWSLKEGAEEMIAFWSETGLDYDAFSGWKCNRLAKLQLLLGKGVLDDQMRYCD